MKLFTRFVALCATLFTTMLVAQPTTAPTAPTKSAADVISVLSAVYTDVSVNDFNPNWGQGTQYTPFPVGGDAIKKYAALDYQGIQIANPTTGVNFINASSMTNMHWDIWTDVATTLRISLVAGNGGGEKFVTKTTAVGWNSYDIPLTDYTSQGLAVSNIIQFKFEENPMAYHAGTKTVYLYNLYFWKPVNIPTITGFSVPAKLTTDAPFTLTAPTSNSSGAFTYMSSDPAVATISGSTVTIVGAGTTTITANQAAASPYIAGSTSASLVVSVPGPPTAAPTPTRLAANVISLFSDAYTDVTLTDFFPNWGQSTVVSNVMIATNTTKKYTNLNYQGIQLAPALDLSSMQNLHIDFWSSSVTTLAVSLINQTVGERAITPVTTLSGWNSLDIPLSSYTASGGYVVALNNVAQIKLEGSPSGGTMYLDNIYFWKAADVPTITGFTVPAKLTTDAPFTLTAPTSNSSGAFTYMSSDPTVATISGSTVTIVGAGTTTITANQAAASPYIAGSTTASLVVSVPGPPTAAPTPTRLAANVISLFSNAYTDLTLTDWFPNWGQSTQVSDVTIATNLTKKYTNLNYQGVQLAPALDLSSMENLHIDFWSSSVTTFTVSLVNQTIGERAVVPVTTLSGWNSLDIPLSSYTAAGGYVVALNNVAQIKLEGSPAGGTVYLDNIYFWKAPITTPTTAAPTPSNAADKVISMFSDTYTNKTIDTWAPSWAPVDHVDMMIAGNNTKKYSNFRGDSYAAATFEGANKINAVSRTFIHLDVWSPTAIPTGFKVKLVDFGVNGTYGFSPTVGDDKEGEVPAAIAAGSWVSLDLPLSDFVTAGLVSRTNLAQLIISAPVGSTVFLDNIYFYDPTALATDMTSFNAKAVNQTTVLNWQTASEKDNAGFTIERSTNGTNFTSIGTVKGNGTTSNVSNYTFTDNAPLTGLNYYRLRQADFNGKESVSKVAAVTFGKSTGLYIKNTLVHDVMDITVGDTEKGPLSIFNISGQLVYSINVEGTQRLNLSHLSAGMYIIRLNSGEAKRFVKD
jgi:Secretion system C-terminal sorting domain